MLYIGGNDIVGFVLVNMFKFIFVVCVDVFYWIFELIWVIDVMMYRMIV